MSGPRFVQEDPLDPVEFRRLCAQTTRREDYRFADEIQQNVVIYHGDRLRKIVRNPDQLIALKSELHCCLQSGPGVLTVREACSNQNVLDRATTIFREIIADENLTAEHRGDHFAKPGDNERIWNALQKFCERDTQAYIDYYSNPVLGIVSEAWLGPCHQMTSQVNIVKPGGQAQLPHRDYHLGFQSDDTVRQFPLSLQIASQFLTLQVAVAHTDMNTDSGPTLLLPFSQQYPPGYLAWRDDRFQDHFKKHAVQLSLKKGDIVFFSPALFHAAGTNTLKTDRIANLLQVSAAFGKTMEAIDWQTISRLVYPLLLKQKQGGQLNAGDLRWLSGAIADNYSFPTNLDTDPPIEGSAPETPLQLIERSLNDDHPPDQFNTDLAANTQRRQA